MMRKSKIAVIGVGYLGKFHVEKFAKHENVELVGVVDIDKNNADNIAKKFNTAAYTDYKELLGKVNAASIVVPTNMHYQVAKDFLEYGADVLIEKPMTTTIEEADELIEIANKRNLIIQVGHLERFNPALVTLKDIIDKPMFIESHRISTYKGRGIDVSVVLDLMIHDIDLIQSFVRSKIKSIHAAGVPVICSDVDIANARIEFDTGCIANVTASRISMKDERKIRIFQKDTYVSVDFVKKEITYVRKDDTKESINELIPGMDIKKIQLEPGDALNAEIQSFINTIQNRLKPEVSGQEGRDALKTALDIIQQMKTRLNQE